MIHHTAVIHPQAQVDSTVQVGPYAVIDANVQVGPGCRIGPHVHLTGHTTIGQENVFHSGCVIGDEPQDLKYTQSPTRLRIGDRNVFREHVTVNRSSVLSEDSIIGSNNLLMAHCHVGHNSILGNYVIVANGALLAGHVTVDDRARISGNCLIHQFVRIGTLAMMQGGSAISKDLPPYTIARGDNCICGLNTIGLRRAGFSSDDRLTLRRLYHLLFRSELKLQAALQTAADNFKTDAALGPLRFVSESKRGICSSRFTKLRPDLEAPESDPVD